MSKQCNACHGVYEPLQADGAEYYHVCPPLSPAAALAAIDSGDVKLSKVDAARVAAARDHDAKHPPKPDESSATENVLAALAVPRPNARNENVRVIDAAAGKVDIVSAGAGAIDVAAEP